MVVSGMRSPGIVDTLAIIIDAFFSVGHHLNSHSWWLQVFLYIELECPYPSPFTLYAVFLAEFIMNTSFSVATSLH